MKHYKYRALVTLLPRGDGDPGTSLPSPACRMVVGASHPETHQSKIFSALVSASDDPPPPGNSRIAVTMTVLGDDANEYLCPCADFTLWGGHSIGRGVITSRIFI
jgi:hypothetical protein